MHRCLPYLPIAAFTQPANAQRDSCRTTVETVARHIGETVLFCGRPMQVRAPENATGDPVHLNFGGAYPDQLFSVIIRGDVSGGSAKS